ncbi:MAG: radical SAM protein [Gemmiger sp.]|nr:radical SAM protein [Gemmiger sp.]
MPYTEKTIAVKAYLTKSNLPVSDYVINPYVGCPHGCKYCYATFMKRFTGHTEPWGSFVDVKQCSAPLNVKKLAGKSVFLSSVTDCYNPAEATHGITRKLLEQLAPVDCTLGISTKSKLILRDLDLLKQCRHLTVSMSINTLDEGFKADMDNASSIADRLTTLKTLHENGIYTVLFISPIFPGITDCIAIMEKAHRFVDEFWFENLNLRGSFKADILGYIREKHPALQSLYQAIYNQKDQSYWADLAQTLERYCDEKKIRYTNYFYHAALVKEKLERQAAENAAAKKALPAKQG